MESVKDRVADVVRDVLGLGAAPGQGDDLERLGADGLDKVEILMNLESQFGISIPVDATDNMATVADAAAIVERRLT